MFGPRTSSSPLAVGDDAGRDAYLAGFHAAQAVIRARTGRTAKTHRGVHRMLSQLARSEPRLADLALFLSQAYNLTDRLALHDALEFARSGDTLIVWKLDRLARSMKQLIETIENLRVRGIGFRSLTEALDTTTAQGRLVFHMFGALAEFERSLIRERTQAGLAAARRVGRTGGRPPKLTDDDIEAAKAMLANPDIGVTQIAHRLGVSPATLYRYILAARTANTPGV